MSETGFIKQEESDDCFRASVATVLGLTLGEVPHFVREKAAGASAMLTWQEGVRAWAIPRGIIPLFMTTPAELAYLLEQTERQNPGVPFVLGGRSKYGFEHAVVACHGRIVHEPTPGMGTEDGGVVAPCVDGNYLVLYFVVLPSWVQPAAAVFDQASLAAEMAQSGHVSTTQQATS